jgi:hypothetical protein
MASIKYSSEYLEEAQYCLARARQEQLAAKKIMEDAFVAVATKILRDYPFSRSYRQQGLHFEFSFQFEDGHVLDAIGDSQIKYAISTSAKRRRYTDKEIAELDALAFQIADLRRHQENYRQLFSERRLPSLYLSREDVL